MRQRKYKPGRLIVSWSQLFREIEAGRYVYMGERPCHPGWLRSMQFNALINLVRLRRFRFCRSAS